jgi:hypothetical protein
METSSDDAQSPPPVDNDEKKMVKDFSIKDLIDGSNILYGNDEGKISINL